VRVSYLEIYNEEARDLLGKDQHHRLEVRHYKSPVVVRVFCGFKQNINKPLKSTHYLDHVHLIKIKVYLFIIKIVVRNLTFRMSFLLPILLDNIFTTITKQVKHYIHKSYYLPPMLLRSSYMSGFKGIEPGYSVNLLISIQVKERPDIGVYVKDLSAFVVNNADDMDRIMTLGNKNSKLMNRYTSIAIARIAISHHFSLSIICSFPLKLSECYLIIIHEYSYNLVFYN